MLDIVIIIMLIMLVSIVYCFSAIYDIVKSVREEIRNLRCSMVAEFEALHGITDDMKDIQIRDLRDLAAWKELSEKAWKELSEKAWKDGDSDD